ncbi:MAG: hypothetical protein U1E45_02005 [Geminicoccaceae bacterium]
MTILAVLAAALLVYGGIAGGLYAFQDSLLFPRSLVHPPRHQPPAGARPLSIDVGNGQSIQGLLVPARTPSRGLLIGFAGNAWNATDFTVFLAERLGDVDIVAFHYRGYPPSQGAPGEDAFAADAAAIYDLATSLVRPTRVFVAGFSIGSGVAARLATVRRVDGLVLVTPFDSIEAVAAERYPLIPVRLLLKHPFRSIDYLRGLPVPTAVIMAEADEVVPVDRSDGLVAALARPVLVETVPAVTHSSLYDGPEIAVALRRALDAVEAAAGG